MDTTKLKASQCWTISSYLNSASSRFEDLANQCWTIGLRDQFLKQRDEAKHLARLFAAADGATLIVEE